RRLRRTCAMATSTNTEHKYFVPEPVPWPFLVTAALLLAAVGAAIWMNGASTIGAYISAAGTLFLFAMVFMWFRGVVNESVAGVYSTQEDMTYRIGMMWFIFTEIMFFGAFFGALFYVRVLSIPWLSGSG